MAVKKWRGKKGRGLTPFVQCLNAAENVGLRRMRFAAYRVFRICAKVRLSAAHMRRTVRVRTRIYFSAQTIAFFAAYAHINRLHSSQYLMA